MHIKDHTIDYLSRLHKMLGLVDINSIEKMSDVLYAAWLEDRTIYIIGNGGSASTASHMACDLNKGTISKNKYSKRMRVISLTDNVAWITAIGNDINYTNVFIEQLENLFHPDDVLIGISASGNSPNIVEAIDWANQRGGTSIGITGFTGGKVKERSKLSVHFPSNDYGPVEDGHLILNHILVEHFKQRLA